MKKPVFYTELGFVVSLLLLALGTALMVQGDFGVSMVTAPAYVLHLQLSQYFPFYTFGVAEYSTQVLALLLMVLLLVRMLSHSQLLTSVHSYHLSTLIRRIRLSTHSPLAGTCSSLITLTQQIQISMVSVLMALS